MLINLSDIPTTITTIEQLHAYTFQVMLKNMKTMVNLKATNDYGIGYVLPVPTFRRTEFQDESGRDWASHEAVLPLKTDRDLVKRYNWLHVDNVDQFLQATVAFPNAYKNANLS